jgi:hypothetical protein
MISVIRALARSTRSSSTRALSRDLTARIVAEYESLTDLALDRERVDLLSGVLRLSELAEYADDAAHAPAMVQFVADWAALEQLPMRRNRFGQRHLPLIG